MGPVIQIIAVILGTVGFFGDIPTLFFIAGGLAILLDLIGFFSGSLNPLFPIVLYIGGYVVAGGWHGIFLGSLFGQVIEVAFWVLALLGGGGYLAYEKIFKKEKRGAKS